MKSYIYDNLDLAYWRILKDLVDEGKQVGNTRELTNVMIQLKFPDQFSFSHNNRNVVSLVDRGLSLEYLLAELVWYFSGDNSTKFISKFGSMWERISDDGVTNNSAYGYILKHKHGFDQVETIIELLQKDKNSRRAVLNINEANPNVITTKDEPCTIALQFLIRDNELEATSIMRSNDIWFGFPYDVVFFTALQGYIANRLGINSGKFTHVVTSLHLYDKDLPKACQIIYMNRVLDYKERVSIDFQGLISNAKRIRDSIDENNFTKEEFMEKVDEFYFIGEN